MSTLKKLLFRWLKNGLWVICSFGGKSPSGFKIPFTAGWGKEEIKTNVGHLQAVARI